MSATREAATEPDEASTSSAAAVGSDEDDGAVLSQLLTKKIVLRNGETMYQIYSRRYRPVLAYKGFIFHYHKQLAAWNITWRCENSHKQNIGFTCNARLRTNWAITELQSVGKPHNERCTANEKAARLQGALNDIRISAEFWSGSLSDLYDEFVGSLEKTDADLVPLFPSLSDETFMKSLELHRTNRLFRKEFRARKLAEEKYKEAAPRKRFSARCSINRAFPETICCECGESVETQENLVTHLQSEHHDDTLKVETFRFGDRLTASRWLRHLHTSSNGSLASLTRDPVDGVVYHLCSLDERIKGSDCTGIHCPAFVKIRMHGEDSPRVDYCLNHSFHGDDEANRRAKLMAPSTFVEQMSVVNIEGRQRRIGAMKCRVLTAFSSSVTKQTGENDISTNPEIHSETVMHQLDLPLSAQTDTRVPAKSNDFGARSRSSFVQSVSSTGDAPISSVEPAPSTSSRQPVLKRQLQKRYCLIDSVIAEIDVECKLILQGSKQMQSVEVAQKCAQLLKEARNMMVQDPCFDYRTSVRSDSERRIPSPPPKMFKYDHSASRKSPSVSKSTDNLKKQSAPIVIIVDKRSRRKS